VTQKGTTSTLTAPFASLLVVAGCGSLPAFASLRVNDHGKAQASGHGLTNQGASIILGMVAWGDREHDIAAWFCVNQGRIAELKKGSHGSSVSAASAADLPPKGPPGMKGRRLRSSVRKSLDVGAKDLDAVAEGILIAALERYETNEA
jgi:hypothetical protein